MSDADGPGRREVAHRLFAAEFDDATYSYSEGDDERAPNYVVTPTGGRVNRLFAVGVLTEVEAVSDDVLRGRVADPTGAFVLYAGQYQPDEQAFLERTDVPTFVALTGKARTFQPEDSQRVFTSVRPESLNQVTAETRDRWVVQTAEQTLDRIAWMASALSMEVSGDELEQALLDAGADDSLAVGIAVAIDEYGTTPTYLDALRETALDATRVVAGERGEVAELTAASDEPGQLTASELAERTPEPGLGFRTSPGDDGEERVAVSDDAPEEVTEPASGDSASSADVEREEAAETAVEETGGATLDEPAQTDVEATAETDVDQPVETAVEKTGEGGVDQPVEETAGEVLDEPEGGEELGAFDPGEFELEADTRREIEAEYGTEFQTGAEVDEPGATEGFDADDSPETPDAAGATTEETIADEEPELERSDPSETERGAERLDAGGSESPESDEDDSHETAEDENLETAEDDSVESDEDERPDDLESAVVELMAELDDGAGAERATVVSEMAARYGVDADETGDAIQDALMAGRCYEPDDATLKPI